MEPFHLTVALWFAQQLQGIKQRVLLWRGGALNISTLPQECQSEWTVGLSYPLDGEDLELVQGVGPPRSLDDTIKIRDLLVQQFSAVEVGERSDRLLIENRGPKVIVERISVEVVSRRPFNLGALVMAPSGGPIWDVLVGFNLDERDPPCRQLNDETGSIDWNGPPGFNGVIALEPGSHQPLNVMTRVTEGVVLWRLVIEYRCGRSRRCQKYPASGAPVKTIGSSVEALQRWVAGRPSPHQALTRCGPGWEPIYEE